MAAAQSNYRHRIFSFSRFRTILQLIKVFYKCYDLYDLCMIFWYERFPMCSNQIRWLFKSIVGALWFACNFITIVVIVITTCSNAANILITHTIAAMTLYMETICNNLVIGSFIHMISYTHFLASLLKKGFN